MMLPSDNRGRFTSMSPTVPSLSLFSVVMLGPVKKIKYHKSMLHTSQYKFLC